MTTRAAILVIVCALGAARSATAQGTPPRRPVRAPAAAWPDRVRISVNVNEQATSVTFNGSTTKQVYLENAVINTTYTVPKALGVDGGILIRLAGNFGVGVAVSSFSKSQSADVSATIPHPFFFNTPRPFTGTSAALEHTELAAHIQAAYAIRSGKIDVVISGGPSLFKIQQALVSDVTYSDTYPYDTVTFTAASTTVVNVSKLGFHAGADLGYRLSRSLGVGGLVRFSRATLVLPLTGSTSGVTVEAGGLQVGGGIRFFF